MFNSSHLVFFTCVFDLFVFISLKPAVCKISKRDFETSLQKPENMQAKLNVALSLFYFFLNFILNIKFCI